MPQSTNTGPVAIVTACMSADGFPHFALTRVWVSPEEFENGVHYDRAEVRLPVLGQRRRYANHDLVRRRQLVIVGRRRQETAGDRGRELPGIDVLHVAVARPDLLHPP